MDYHELGKEIVQNVGGPDNIESLTHCMTPSTLCAKRCIKSK